ncbi:MAG: prolyl-tRNA synthetase associated domain-containing protein [Candidatus Buchananbacteria bacterium]|nr:prolyl-tRNA synthetase associated domain-containing protein [Candidatus Buchananbacteria bacterium]
MPNLEQFLQDEQITYILHEHPAVYTCEEAEKYCSQIPGLATKNLFLKNQKKNRYFLIILPADKQADLKKIAAIVNEKKLSFANPDELQDKLGLQPGAVSPFGLINDDKQAVEVYIDKDVYNAEIVSFHPNRNTASLELTSAMWQKYLNTIDHDIKVINL